jgi:hypothetical protein
MGTAREILKEYYARLSDEAARAGLLCDDFSVSGALAKESGKDGFGIELFYSLVKSLAIREIIADNERACALISYELGSPKSEGVSLEAAEIWAIKGEKLASLEIYFDTAAYQKFMLPILFPMARLKNRK